MVSRVGKKLRTTWVLPIHTWAGRATLAIVADGIRTELALDVAPHPGKLGSDAFRELLAELVAVHKDLVAGVSPGAVTAVRAAFSPPLVHPEVLDSELPALAAALVLLAREPLTQIERVRRSRRLAAVQRTDTHSLTWIAARPSIGRALRQQRAGEPADLDVAIDTPHLKTTTAHPATRYIRHALERLVRSLRMTSEQLRSVARGFAAGHRDDEVRAKAAVAATRVDLGLDVLRHHLRLPPLSDVAPLGPTPAAIQAVVDHPVYSRVQRIVRRLLDPGTRLDETGLLDVGLRRTHELFEMLVSYRIAQRLQQSLGPQWSCELQGPRKGLMLVGPPEGLMWSADGPGGVRLELRNQQRFPSWANAAGKTDFASLSGERRPDHVLTCSTGSTPRWWIVLDSKYRAARGPVHEGLADVHVYRDALRWRKLACAGAFIVVPALAPNATCYGDPTYRKTHAFGAVSLAEDPLALLGELGLTLPV